MGETIVRVKISSVKNFTWKEVETIIDTGATYTTVPSKILEELNIEKTDKTQIELGDGRVVERNIGTILIEVEGKKAYTPVIFGEEKDAMVLGVVTLEECRLSVDPVNKKIVPVVTIHHYKVKI